MQEKKQFIDSYGNTADHTAQSAIGPIAPRPSLDPNVRYLAFPSTGAQVIPEGPETFTWEPGPHDVIIRSTRDAMGRVGYVVKTQPEKTEENSGYQVSQREPMAATDGQPVEHAGSDNHPLNDVRRKW